MRVLKTVLIVIFALLFAVSGGLLCFGIINPASEAGDDYAGIGPEPSKTFFDGEGATYVDVSSVLAAPTTISSTTATTISAEEAVDLMIKTAYNLINIQQFYFSARVDVNSGSTHAFSDYNYTRDGLKTFKKAFAYTGSAGTYILRCYYIDQKLESSGTSSYNEKSGKWKYTLDPGLFLKKTKKTRGKDRETPYYYYGTLDFPLDFGGADSADDDSTEVRTEAINYSLIDPASATLQDKGSYYALTFKALPDKLNASEETKYRLSKSTADGKMTDIQFADFTVTAEIWKETGVFRMLYYKTNVHASLNVESGDCVIEKSMKFSYDDDNCSVAKKIKSIEGTKGLVFYNALSSANKATCDAEIAALESK